MTGPRALRANPLLNIEEHDVVCEVIAHCDDQPSLGHFAPRGRRLEIARRMRDRLKRASEHWLKSLMSKGAGTGAMAQEFHAAICLDAAIERVANRLEQSEGQILPGDETLAMAMDLRSEWDTFLAEVAAPSALRTSKKQSERASAPRKVGVRTRAAVRAGYQLRLDSGTQRGAIKFLANKLNLSVATVSEIVADLRPQRNRK